jgi:hypothetical protein
MELHFFGPFFFEFLILIKKKLHFLILVFDRREGYQNMRNKEKVIC